MPSYSLPQCHGDTAPSADIALQTAPEGQRGSPGAKPPASPPPTPELRRLSPQVHAGGPDTHYRKPEAIAPLF